MRDKSASILCFCLAFVTLLLTSVVTASAAQRDKDTTRGAAPQQANLVAGASTAKPDDAADAPSKPASATPTEAERIRALEEALQRQDDKLNAMQKVIEEQQRMIQLLNAGSPASVSAVTDAAPAKETATTAPALVQQIQQPTLEERVK